MQRTPPLGCIALIGLAACAAHRPGPPPVPVEPAPVTRKEPAAPQTPPPVESAPQAPEPGAAAVAPPAAESPSGAAQPPPESARVEEAPAPAPVAPQKGLTKEKPAAARSPAKPPAAEPPPAPAPAPAPTSTPPAVGREPAAPAPPTLDLASLEQRLRDTRAIGVFTKLSLKNQVDDLLDSFRGFHQGHIPPTLSALRQSYELLLMKVVTLLQNGDPQLASAVSASRDAIWALLEDPKKFAQISMYLEEPPCLGADTLHS